MTKNYQKNPTKRFEAKLGEDEFKEVNDYLKKQNMTKREFVVVAVVALREQDNHTNGQFPKDK